MDYISLKSLQKKIIAKSIKKIKILCFFTLKILKMIKYNLTFITGVTMLTLVSCNNATEKKIETKVEAEIENNFNSDEYEFVLPQPISLAKAFQASGLEYHINITNPVGNKNKYNEKVKQLLNFGLFSTDLAYCVTNNKSQDARNYLKVIQELGVEVGLKPVFSDKSLLEKFEKNINNKEAMEDLIFDIQERSEEYMQDNDIRYLSIVQFSGSWTEAMYLGIKDIEITKKSIDQLSVTLVDQIGLLKKIIKGIKTYPTSDQTLTKVSENLSSILEAYNSFQSVKDANASASFTVPKLSNSEYKTLSTKIIELRNFITQ